MRTRTLLKAMPLLVAMGLWLPAVSVHAQVAVVAGDLIKLPCTGSPPPDDICRSVYYYAANGKRYVFPNSKTYFTWYADYSNIKTIPLTQMYTIPIGGNVTYRPGVRMLKIQSDPKVYVISKNGILREVPSEAVASTLYGSSWNQMIDDVPDAFFVNYKTGAPLFSANEYDKGRLVAGSPNINVDKLLVDPPSGFIDIRAAGFVPGSTTVPWNTPVTWTALESDGPHVTADPSTDLPNLDSSPMSMGATYTYTFTTKGTWKVMNATEPSEKGTITVQ